MITYRVELSMTNETDISLIWNNFCKWKIQSPYITPETRNWLKSVQNKSDIYSKRFTFMNGSWILFETHLNSSKECFIIQMQEYQINKTFITTIIFNTTHNTRLLSFTLEELNNDKNDNSFNSFKTDPKYIKYLNHNILHETINKTIPEVYINKDTSIDLSKVEEILQHTGNIYTTQKNTSYKSIKEIENFIVTSFRQETAWYFAKQTTVK